MNSTIVSKVYESVRNTLKISHSHILYVQLMNQYTKDRKNMFDVFNSNMECICFIDDILVKVLLKKELIKIIKTEIGDSCFVLTNDEHTNDVLLYQTVLVTDGEL